MHLVYRSRANGVNEICYWVRAGACSLPGRVDELLQTLYWTRKAA
jgi:hypothetical protein